MQNLLKTVMGGIVWLWVTASLPAALVELIPSVSSIKPDRPRLLLRSADTPLAISLPQLKSIPRDPDFQQMLQQLETLKPPRAAALALAYQLTGQPAAAEKALTVLQSWQMPKDQERRDDPFNVYFTLMDLALAYDWLYPYAGFDLQAKTALRLKLQPWVENAVKLGNDHVFHNYIWMYNGGAMLWALATAGEDPVADRLFTGLRQRFNEQLFPAMTYLAGANGDSAGYWWLYCQPAATLVALATQSAFETEVIGKIHRQQGDWLNRQLDYLVFSVLPDQRFMPWGDIVAGANGGVTHEMAAKIDALTWALQSPRGAYLSRWLAGKRGLERFHGETVIDYFLYTRHLATEPAKPPLALLAGNQQGGNVLMRSDWSEEDTVVGFRCTDFFGQHLHLDQGSFVIYRNGWLALDAGTYQRVGGNQMKTDAHNTLLLGSEGQRRQSYQSASTLAEFTRRLPQGLETGDILFYQHAGEWTAVAGQFAQAYSPQTIYSCVRQLLFIRPGTIVVVDHLEAPEGKALPEIQWLLHVPGRPALSEHTATASNSKSYLRCRALTPSPYAPRVEDSYRTPAGSNAASGHPTIIDTSRIIFSYAGQPRLTLIHLLEVGDGKPALAMPGVKAETEAKAVRLQLEGKTYAFSSIPPFAVKLHQP